MCPRTTLRMTLFSFTQKNSFLLWEGILTGSSRVLNSTIYSFTSPAESQMSTYLSTSTSTGDSRKIQTTDALIGKTIIIVANLKPAKLMGIESQGMVLAAGDSEVRGLATLLEE